MADLHAITTSHQPEQLMKLRSQTAAYLLATGVADGDLFIQSQIHGHCKLCFMLGCHVNLGTLQRMTQFKTKTHSNLESLALLNYPLLMASDILLYDADVLVGNDQKQHVELIRDLAIKLNNKMGAKIFYPPQMVTTGFFQHRLRDLQTPEKKMSKSFLRSSGTIFLADSKAKIIKKLLRAKTDSDNQILFDFDKKPGVSNLILIYSLLENTTIDQATQTLNKQCHNYHDLKMLVAQKIVTVLAPIQRRAQQYEEDPSLLKAILARGKERAQTVVNKKFQQIQETLGFNFDF